MDVKKSKEKKAINTNELSDNNLESIGNVEATWSRRTRPASEPVRGNLAIKNPQPWMEEKFPGDYFEGQSLIGPCLFSKYEYDTCRKGNLDCYEVLGDGSINAFIHII